MSQSQHSTIIRMLKSAGQTGVPNYKFPQAHILCYSKRISELRRDGHNIRIERDKLPNGRSTNVLRYFLEDEKLLASVVIPPNGVEVGTKVRISNSKVTVTPPKKRKLFGIISL